MMLGDMKFISGRFGNTEACVAPDGQELYPLLRKQLENCMANLPTTRRRNQEQEEEISTEGCWSSRRHENLYLSDTGRKNILWFGRQAPSADITGKKAERIVGLCGSRDALREVIDIQSTNMSYDPAELRTAQSDW